MTQPLSDEQFLLTGANGKLGQLLSRIWSRNPPGGIYPRYLARAAPADLLWSPGDSLTSIPSCSTVIAAWGCTAGNAGDLAQNTTLAGHALQLARACGASRVLHLSSAAVYGPGQDLSETTDPAPTNAYGRAKLAMEDSIRSFPSEGIHHCCLRLSNVIGADSLAPALRPSTQPITLDRFPNGQGPWRSYIAPVDLARVLAALALLPPPNLPGILNVAAPHAITMESLARAADREIQWMDAPKTAVQTVTLDNTRLARLLPDIIQHTTALGMVSDWQQLEAHA